MTRPALPRADVLAWLEAWQNEVQQQQFEAASSRFAPDAYSFGTVMHAVPDRASLMANQWRAVWPRTRNFRFIPDTIRAWGDEAQQTIAAQWESEGLDASDGSPYKRLGRASIALQRQGNAWVAVHTHLSISPTSERFLPQPWLA